MVTKRQYYSNPHNSLEYCGKNAQSFNVELDGTAGNGAIGNVEIVLLPNVGTRPLKITVVSDGLTPDTGTPLIKFTVAGEDLTDNISVEDLNDNGVSEFSTSAVATDEANQHVLMEISGAAVSGNCIVIVEYLLP